MWYLPILHDAAIKSGSVQYEDYVLYKTWGMLVSDDTSLQHLFRKVGKLGCYGFWKTFKYWNSPSEWFSFEKSRCVFFGWEICR
jgi:hypothetical protein